MQDRHLDRAAVDRLGDRDRHGYLEVAVVEPAEDRGRGHFRGHVEIAVGTAARARLAFAGEPDAGAVFDPGGDVDFVALALLGRAGALAGGAGGLDDLAAAAALGARLGDREEALVLRVDAAAFAARAGDRRGAGRGAGAVAGLAAFLLRHCDAALGAVGRLVEAQVDLGREVTAAARLRAGAAAPAAAVEDAAEDVAEIGTEAARLSP